MDASERFARAAARYRKAQGDLADARRELQGALVDARAAGVTLQALGKELGVTRQRILEMLKER